MSKFLVVLLPAVWVVAIAIIAVQNATPVSLQFLNFRSIEMPFGVVLAFCAAGGMGVAAGGVALLSSSRAKRSLR